MNKTLQAPQPLAVERRKGERRQLEGNPPGRHERRRGIEARQPDVTEIEMSNSDWVALTEFPATWARK